MIGVTDILELKINITSLFVHFNLYERYSVIPLNLFFNKVSFAIGPLINPKTFFFLINSRAILNFGHTFGHAIESINQCKSSISHGEAISIGMVIATKLSCKLNKISKKEMIDIITHIKNAKLPTYTSLIKKNNFYKKIINDKKNRNNKMNLILLKNIGNAYFSKNHKLSEIKKMILNIN